MDVDEQTEHAAPSIVGATVNDEEFASSSKRTTNTLTRENSENKKVTSFSKELATNSAGSNGVNVCRETISHVTEEGRGERETPNDAQERHLEETNDTISEEHKNKQYIENAGIDPNYPLVLVRRVSIPSSGDNSTEGPAENNNEFPVAMDEENGDTGEGEDMRPPPGVLDILNLISTADSENEDEVDDDEDLGEVWSEEEENEAAVLNVNQFNFHWKNMDVDEQTEHADPSIVVATVNDEEFASSSNRTTNTLTRENSENKKDIAFLKELAINSAGSHGVDVCSEAISHNTEEETSERETPNDAQERHLEETNDTISEEHQNEQHIENAGIDPNYPLVLVRRVSIPSSGDNSTEGPAENNNEFSVAMDEENDDTGEEGEDMRSPPGVLAIFNSISTAGSENEDEDEVDDDEDLDEVWSEEEENEAAVLENPNFRGFANQFEAIRNMIAHTRRSMAEAEANFGPIPPNSLMQRFRRILYILNYRRRRLIHLGLTTPNIELQGVEAFPEVQAANEDTTEHNDAEITDNPPNEEGNNMTIEQEEEMNENAVRFDTNLPAEHSYMGDNMSRVSGVNYLEAGQCIKLRLFMHQHVLFPGELLPFMVDSSTNIINHYNDEQNGILFGVCFPCLSDNTTATRDPSNSAASNDKDLIYGVTFQIYELGEDNRNNTLIKSRALQRFVTNADELTVPLESINGLPRMKCFGYVKILPDIYLPDPLKCINMGSSNRFRDNVSMQDMYKRFQAATTPWPAHVYETHNITNIIEKARTQLAQHKINTMPSDPTQLSYWLVRNLHLPEEMLKSIFLENIVNTRLKLIAGTFKKESIFSCRNCVAHIADCRELFAMSKHGVQSQYCNSAGFIHETNTLYQVNRENIIYSGSPSTEFSWFPGYQWHIIICKICKHHLGWEFTAVEPNLIPKQFFGISSSSVRVRLAEESNDIPAQNAVYINFLRLMNAGMNELRGARNNMPHI